MRLKRRIRAMIDHLEWRLRGARYHRPLALGPARRLLFVCKGNICRSPYAAHAAAKILAGSVRPAVECVSAGIDVRTPSPSPENAVAAARLLGVALDGHRSRQLDAPLLAASEAIFVMEGWQFDHLHRRFPECRPRLFLLPLFDGGVKPEDGLRARYNISDPYGQGVDAYIACFRRIDRCLAAVRDALPPAADHE